MSSSATKVFVPDNDHVWVAAEIISDTDEMGFSEVLIQDEVVDSYTKRINMRKLPFGLSSLPLQNPDLLNSGVDDMCTLNFLHEASILDNLRRRFGTKFPYTYTGDICIAVNPYQWLDIYHQQLRDLHANHLRHEQSPHVYSTSATAYRGLRDRNRNQSILVSGESGAGKTETVKILMDHLASIASKRGDETINKVLQANPLLESFGNAKTARNDNSSRFGKFTELQFDENFLLVGSKCVTYLLEKSRVVTQSEVERNYHVLYQLLASPPEVKDTLLLSGSTCDTYHYTAQGDQDTNIIEGRSDAERFAMTVEALNLLSVSEQLRLIVFQGLAGILHLGQVQLVMEGGDADKSTVQNLEDLDSCCRLLGLNPEEFKTRITSRSLDVEGTRLSVPLSVDQAISGRDALAKEIYARIFQWLVHVINYNTISRVVSANPREKKPSKRSIALLDIFGFESFRVNRFEQLCINYANEKLQQKFTLDVFKNVQSEYREEGLEWESIGFNDNADTLEMIEGTRGILATLNEECLVPKGSDPSYLTKLKRSLTSCPSFSVELTSKDEFTITHYAGKVSYNVIGFLERNKDALAEDVRSLMASSTNPVLSNIFTNAVDLYGNSTQNVDISLVEPSTLLLHLGNEHLIQSPSSPTRSKRSEDGPRSSMGGGGLGPGKSRRGSFLLAESVTIKFKSQLTSLMETIGVTEVQYVRCIKPNRNKSSIEFNRQMVVEQLRSAGMIEAIRISRAAYPYRVSFKDFTSRFGALKSGVWYRKQEELCRQQVPASNGNSSEAERLRMRFQCNAMLQELVVESSRSQSTPEHPGGKMYELGKSKLYFGGGVLEQLESLRSRLIHNKVRDIQRVFRGRKVRRSYLRLRTAAIMVQKRVRLWEAVKSFILAQRAIRKIQSVLRMSRDRKKVHELRLFRASSLIQSVQRMVPLRRRYLRSRQAAILIQSLAKMRFKVKRYIKLRDKAREDRDVRNRLAVVQNELLAKCEVIESLEAALFQSQEEFKAQLESQKSELEGLFQGKLEASLQTLQQEITLKLVDSESERLKLQDELSLLKSQHEDTLETLATTTSQCQEELAKNTELASSILEKDSEISRLASTHHDELQHFQSRFDAKCAEFDSLHDQFVSVSSTLESKQQEFEQSQQELVELTSQLSESRSQFEDQITLLKQQLDSQTSAHSEEISHYQAQLEEQKQHFENQLTELQHEKEKASEDRLAEKNKFNSLLDQLPTHSREDSFADILEQRLKEQAQMYESRLSQQRALFLASTSSSVHLDSQPHHSPKSPNVEPQPVTNQSPPSSLSPTSNTETHDIFTTTSKKLRFKMSDLRAVYPGKSREVEGIPESIDDALCLHLDIEGKGLLNLVLDTPQKRNSVLEAFSVLIQKKVQQITASSSPIKSPLKSPKKKPFQSTPCVTVQAPIVLGHSEEKEISEPEQSVQTVEVVHQGWVMKEESKSHSPSKQSLLSPSKSVWSPMFASLEVHGQGEVRIVFSLSDSTSSSTNKFEVSLQPNMNLSIKKRSGNAASLAFKVLELRDSFGQPVLRMKFDNEADLNSWFHPISMVFVSGQLPPPPPPGSDFNLTERKVTYR